MDDFELRMEPLRARFSERAQIDGSILKTALAERDIILVQKILHRLAGSAGLFGYPELSRVASELECALDEPLPVEQLEEFMEEVFRQLPAKPRD